MNCYDFELNISAYIEGELKQTVREDCNQHKDTCKNCEEKLVDIAKLMENLPSLMRVTTSNQFDQELHEKIREIDNRGPSVWKRLLEMKPLGFEPVPALGFALAIMMIISASYLLLNEDALPNVEKLSTQSQKNTAPNFKPSVIAPKQNIPSIADSDTSGKSDAKHIDKRIQLVGRK